VKKKVVQQLQKEHGYSQRRACKLTRCNRNTARHISKRQDDSHLRKRLQDLAQQQKRWGYRMLNGALRFEGWRVNHKHTYRLYKEEKLELRPKHRKRLRCEKRGRPTATTAANEVWTMDFTSDRLCNGRSFRTLNVIDVFTRRCLAIETDTSLSSERGTLWVGASAGRTGATAWQT
jgi:putative transposase